MLFVPGRLCLFGEHADWAGTYRRTHPEIASGACLVVGTDQGLAGEIEKRDGAFEITSVLPDGATIGPERIAAAPESLHRAATSRGFFGYAAGVALEIAERFGARGLGLVIRADLPIGKGLSSSAAASVLVARAFNHVHELALSIREEMEIAYAGERRAGSECGRMDQVCALGRRPTLLRFDGDRMKIEPLGAEADVHLLIVDLRRGKDTRRILADLNRCFPDTLGPVAAGVRAALGVENIDIVSRARTALVGGHARLLGDLMSEAQALFDRRIRPACPELEAPRLHALLAHPAVAELAWGGKGVGSQGDGCAQLVARGLEERAELSRLLERELDVACLPLTIEGKAEG